ncbi:MAG: ABC transporter permease, partial [Microbacteriaceae bacterium]
LLGLRRLHGLGLWPPAAVALFFVILGVLGPFFFHYPAGYTSDVSQGPSWAHPFGTDSLGLDILAESVWGARTSLFVVLGAGVITVVIGTTIGLLSAYSKWCDRIFGTIIDVMLSLPLLPLMIVLAAFAGPSLLTLVVIIGAFSWPELARIVRSRALQVLIEPYVDASRALGSGPFWLLSRSVLPVILPLVALHGALASARAVLAEASLSFLGLSDSSVWSWGRILHNAQRDGVLVHAWWQALFPSLCILLFIASVTLIGLRMTERFDGERMKLPAR